MIQRLLILCYILVLPLLAGAQVCGLAEDEYQIDLNSTTIIPFEINNVINDDLSDPGQGVCGVKMSIQLGPEVIEFEISLISPAGQKVVLIGPLSSPTGFLQPPTRLNITFLPSYEIAEPDPNFPSHWNNTINNGYPPLSNPGYRGSYYPYDPVFQLEDFNLGSVNGTWQLVVEHTELFGIGPNTLFDLRIILCDDTGQDCCFANAGNLLQEDVKECEGSADLLLDLPPSYRLREIQPDTTVYGYTYALSQGGNLLGFDSIPDLSGLPAGEYEVCGLSYQRSEKDSLITLGGIMTLDSLRRNLQSADSYFCGNISDDCVTVTILPNADPVFRQDAICLGDSLFIGTDTLTTAGLHTVILDSANGCDSIVEVDLTLFASPVIDSLHTLCSGDSILIGDSVYKTSGIYSDTLQTINGCDSIINLDLTVLSLLTTTVMDTICTGGSYPLGDSLFTQSGLYQVVLFANTGCDSTVNLNLTVLDVSAEILTPDTITCSLPEVSLSARNNTGNSLNYAWYDSNDNLVGSDSTVMVNQSGNYSLVSSLQQCTAQDTITVIDNLQAPLAETGPPDTLNCGAKAQLVIGSLASSQGSDFTYKWTTDTGHFVDTNDQLQVTVDSSGIYQLVVTDLRNGCKDASSVGVFANTTPPLADAGSIQFITCTNPIVMLDGSLSTPGLEYNWTALTGALQPTSNDPLRPLVSSEGVYELTVRNPANECSSTDLIIIASDTITPIVNIDLPEIITCDQPQIQLNGQLMEGGSDPVIEWTAPGNNSIIAGENTLAPTVAEAGEYRLLVTNPDNGCSNSTQIITQADLTPPLIDIQQPDTFRCTEQNITLEYLTNRDPDELTIQWSDPLGGTLGTALSQEVNEPGIYQLEVTNKSNGCTAIESIGVIDNSTPPSVTFSDLIKPCDVNTLFITTFIDQDPALFSYQWTGSGIISGANTLQPRVNGPGDYILTLSYLDIACSFTDTAKVTEPPCGPCLETDPAPSFTCRENNLQLDVRYCDECIGCTIEWTTSDGQIRAGANTLSPTIGQAGTYTISVTDSFNITAQLDITVSENRDFPIAEAGPDTTLNCRVSSLQLGSIRTDEGTGFQIRWRSQSTGSTALSNTPFLEVDQSDTYILEVQNLASSCISRDTAIIGLDTIPPQANAGPDMNLTCLQSTLLLDGTNSVSDSGITYLWTASNGGQIDFDADTPTPQISAPGTYFLQVFDDTNGCSASDVVVVGLSDTPPVISLPEPDMLTCIDSVILLEPLNIDTTLFRYEWCGLDVNGDVFDCSGDATYEVRSPGQYRVQVTDRLTGCNNTEVISVLEDRTPPLANAGQDTTINCLNNQIQLEGTANSASVTFAWASPDGQILSGNDTAIPVIEGAGQYILTTTDLNNGCSSSDTVQVTANLAPPEARLAQDINQLLLTCQEDTLFLDASPSLSTSNQRLNFLWTTNEEPSGIIGANNGSSIEIVSGGFYHLTVQDQITGCRDTLSFQVNISSIKPGINLSSAGSISCLQTEVVINASNSETGAGIRHRWYLDDQLLSDTNLILAVTEGGTYRLESTYLDNGCSNEEEVVITADNTPPQIDMSPPVILDCDNPAATLDASATLGQALRFTWTTNDGNIVSGQNTPIVTVNAPGVYSLQVVDGRNGCSTRSSTEVSLTGLSIGEINMELTPPSCPGDSDGSVRVLSVEGGTDPFVIALNDDNFKTTDEFAQLPPGTYQLTVMDAAGCEADTTFTLQEPEGVQVSLGPDLKIRQGEEVRLEAQHNIKQPQIINWFPAELVPQQDTLVQILQPNRSATYKVEITDERGCTGSIQVQILVSNEVPVYISNAFSPNEDGENDYFFIQAGSAVSSIKSFRIFDRWGNTIFEATDITPNDPLLGWDGYYQGQLMNAAVFVYFAELELAGGEVEMVQGEVLLVR